MVIRCAVHENVSQSYSHKRDSDVVYQLTSLSTVVPNHAVIANVLHMRN